MSEDEVPEGWTHSDIVRAHSDGWRLSSVVGIVSSNHMRDDTEVVEHVYMMAAGGSPLHTKAIKISFHTDWTWAKTWHGELRPLIEAVGRDHGLQPK